MLRRGVVILGLVFVLFGTIHVAQAAGTLPSEFNPVCWKQDECTKIRADMLRKSGQQLSQTEQDALGAGWVQDPQTCPGDGWGKCLPGNITITKIAIGGKTRFLHIGDYIQTIYKYILGIVGILAAIMMVIAGAQWVTSGGNAESISSAKHRIVNAIIGMFLAYTSFFILNTINPALVNLRLPQIYLVKPQNMVPAFCAAAPSTTVFAFAADTKDQTTPVSVSSSPDFDKNGLTYSQITGSDKGYCGHRFFMKNAGTATCFGSYCQQGVCSNIDIDNGPQKTYSCHSGNIIGMVTYDAPLGDVGCVGALAGASTGWEKPEIMDTGIFKKSGEGELWIVCGKAGDPGGHAFEVSALSEAKTFPNYQVYALTTQPSDVDSAVSKCGQENRKVKGFVMKFEMNRTCNPNDQNHWLGWDGSGEAVDLGVDETFFSGDFVASKNALKIPDSYFIPPEAVKNGVTINVDAVQVFNIHNESEYSQYNYLYTSSN